MAAGGHNGAGATDAALDRERERRRQVEAELAAVRSSESFRVGQVLVTVLRDRGAGALRRRLSRVARTQRPQLGAGGAPDANGADGRPARDRRRLTDAVLFVWLGDGEHEPAVALTEVRNAVTMLVALKPILLTDVGGLAETFGDDLPIEHVIPLREWRARRPAAEWGAYVADRVSDVMAEFSPAKVVVLTPLHAPGALSAVLAPVVLPAMAGSEVNQLDER